MRSTRDGSRPAPLRRAGPGVRLLAAAIICLLAVCFGQAAPSSAPSFTKDVAPVIYAHCAGCHRPGQGAPFSLLTYAQAKKHADDIDTVVASRSMPPWPPGSGFGEFEHSRALSEADISLFHRWTEAGAPEGPATDLPALPPQAAEGWQLGKPDLVVTLPKPYRLDASGKDVYRNFVISVPLAASRYVRAVEFQPGNAACVHHAFVKLARTPAVRRLDGQEEQPGFGGLMLPEGVEMPEGHFLTWQPGKIQVPDDPRLAWRLDPGNDLVLQLHLRPSGKPEVVQPSVALYFSDRPPSLSAFKFALSTFVIDLPPGAPDTVVRDQWELPAGLRLLRVLPHAHYLGKDLQGYATLSDGSRRWLVRIRDWDFNWQGDYVYKTPVDLPRGTVVTMEYHYDNSTNNVRNPAHPPRRVAYGPGSSDEMAELWFQALPLEAGSLPLLKKEYNNKIGKASLEYAEYRLAKDPSDVRARVDSAKVLLGIGKRQDAGGALQKALAISPDDEEARYLQGVLFRLNGQLADARREFEHALKSNPNNGKAHGNLGIVLAGLGELDGAEFHLGEALKIDPDDSLAHSALEELKRIRKQRNAR